MFFQRGDVDTVEEERDEEDGVWWDRTWLRQTAHKIKQPSYNFQPLLSTFYPSTFPSSNWSQSSMVFLEVESCFYLVILVSFSTGGWKRPSRQKHHVPQQPESPTKIQTITRTAHPRRPPASWTGCASEARSPRCHMRALLCIRIRKNAREWTYEL